MGLDWIVGAKPRDAAGYEILKRALAKPSDKALLEAWQAVPTINSWETLDAPRVGSSKDADDWFAAAHLQGLPEDEVKHWLDKNRGVAVVALVKCDGVPRYSNAPMSRDLEYTSFRGQFLADMVPVFGDAMFKRAHDNMLPDELQAFGAALEALASKYASENGVAHLAARHEPPEDAGGPASLAHIMASAARWCLFWSKRGHWLNTWW